MHAASASPADRWSEIEPLLDAALDLPARDRATFLERACGSDVALLDVVTRVLAATDGEHEELDGWAGDLYPDLMGEGAATSNAPPGLLAERYQIERELGRGGMAVVYLATDVRLQRQVAVKVMKPELTGDADTQRFTAEIRTTANLRHANIVPLFDSGASDGWTYFVMPYVAGETLRDRMRQGAVSVHEAVRIVRAVLAGLSHAHHAGVIHRDVKPSNVMLVGDEVLLADFGIARATHVTNSQLTASGLAIGTPAYMSPEQFTAKQAIGPASDVYSTGCVLHELMVGRAPVSVVTRLEMSESGSDPLASLGSAHPELPADLVTCVQRAMALAPHERYASAGEFSDALGEAVLITHTQRGVATGEVAAPSVAGAGFEVRHSAAPRWRDRIQRHRVGVGGAIIGLVALASIVIPILRSPATAIVGAAVSDSTRYVVFPVSGRIAGVNAAQDGAQGVRDALRQWRGISVVDNEQVREALGSRRNAALSSADAASIARQLRAGRYVRGEITDAGAVSTLHLRLYDGVNRDSLLIEVTSPLTAVGALADSPLRLVVDSLLLRDLGPSDLHVHGTQSLPARQAYGRAWRAVRVWKLASADSAFDLAARLDPFFAQAQLGIALMRLWRGDEPARWQVAAAQAIAGSQRLSARERDVARAVEMQSRGELGDACPIWRTLVRGDSLDALAWYGAAQCQTADNIVIADVSSPSGWRFRSSYHRALRDYERAFRLQPSMLAAFGADAQTEIGRVFKTGTSQLRSGRAAPPSTSRYRSSMEWRADSLLFIPYLVGASPNQRTFKLRNVDALNDAMRNQRALVRRIASTWVSAFPDDPMALQSLALALAAQGERSALDTLARATVVARSASERQRLASAAFALPLAFALRDGDTSRVRALRAVADSILASRAAAGADDAVLLTSLAALTGRAELAAGLARDSRVADRLGVPEPLRDGVPTYLLRAVMGGPRDSLGASELRAADAIQHNVPLEQQPQTRLEFLARGASMAFPLFRSPMLSALARDGDPLVVVEHHWARGDTAAVRASLANIHEKRRGILPEHLALDALAPEAFLLWSLGDAAGVVEWIGPTLGALPKAQPALLSSPLVTASLVPMLVLRARAAARIGDVAGARRWAVLVVILWSDADPFLQPLVAEARQLAR